MHIITLTKNSQKTIGKTLLSIEKQSFKKVKWIVLDEHSTDSTLDIVKKSKIKKEIIKIRSKNLFDAYNKSLKILKKRKINDIIFFLHSDDIIYDKNVLKDINEIFQKNHCDCLYGNIVYFKKNSNVYSRYWYSGYKKKEINIKKNLYKMKIFYPIDFLFGWSFPHTALFFHSNALNKMPKYNSKLKTSSDFEWTIKLLLKKNIRFYFFDRRIIKMKIGGTSTKFLNILKHFLTDYIVIKNLFYKNLLSIPFCIFLLAAKKISKIKQFF